MPLMNFNGDSGADFSGLSGMDYSNYGSSDAGGSEEFERNENPYARLAASSGGRQAFARNPTDFTLPGVGGTDDRFSMGDIQHQSIDYLYDHFLAGGGIPDVPGMESLYQNYTPGNLENGQPGTYSGDLRADLIRLYGENGITEQNFWVPNSETSLPRQRGVTKNSRGEIIKDYTWDTPDYSDFGLGRDLTLSVIGLVGGSAIGAAAGGGALGGAAGGAFAGGIQALPSGDIGKGALRGGLIGALGGGLQQGASSALDEWTTQAGNNPSAYRPGVLTQGQNQALSRAIANTGTTAARGGDYRQAALGGLLPMAGQMAQPYLNQGVSGLSSLFSGGDMPDDFFGGGDFSTDLNMRDWGRTGMPTAAEFNGDPSLDMASWGRTGMPTDEDWYGSGGNGFNGVQNQPADQYSLGGMSVFGSGDGMQVGPGPTSMSGAPNNINPDDWSRKLREFIGGDAGRGAMRAFGILNPKYGQMLGALMPQQPGGKMSGMEAGLGALATLYASNRANKNLKQQIGGLQGLFGQDSPYAQQLRQTLSRKDAAAGRRSQYGPREVELQARLAELNSRNAPQLAQLYGAQDMNRSRMLRDMLIYGQQSGLTRQIGEGLSSLFGG